MKPVAVGIPESLEQFQLALDAAFAAGITRGKAQQTPDDVARDALDAKRYRAEGERAWGGSPEFSVDYVEHPCTKEDFLTARDAYIDAAMSAQGAQHE